MICPGLHCPGCSGRQSAGVAAAVVAVLVVADRVIPWVAARVWWIGSTAAVCFALAVAASMWLEGRTARREAAFAASRGIWSRADYIAPVRQAAELPLRQVPGIGGIEADGPASIPPPQVIVNIFGMPSAEQAEVIRRAISGGTQ